MCKMIVNLGNLGIRVDRRRNLDRVRLTANELAGYENCFAKSPQHPLDRIGSRTLKFG